MSAALRNEPSTTWAYTFSVVSTFACPINCAMTLYDDLGDSFEQYNSFNWPAKQ